MSLSNATSSCLWCRTLVAKETSACDKNECYRACNENENLWPTHVTSASHSNKIQLSALVKQQKLPRKTAMLFFLFHVRLFNRFCTIQSVSGHEIVCPGRRSFIGLLFSSLFSIMMRRLTPSMTFWTSSTSENPSLSKFEMSKTPPSAAVSTPPEFHMKWERYVC